MADIPAPNGPDNQVEASPLADSEHMSERLQTPVQPNEDPTDGTGECPQKNNEGRKSLEEATATSDDQIIPLLERIKILEVGLDDPHFLQQHSNVYRSLENRMQNQIDELITDNDYLRSCIVAMLGDHGVTYDETHY